MPKVSVIIPIYNTEKYLKECLDSVINQTLTDIEIICIDDGSTDGSLNILKGYALNDDRIKILKQKNKGAGAARNLGIKNATGEFVNFFDSDDYMKPEMLKELYNKAIEIGSDITVCRSIIYRENSASFEDVEHSIERKIIGSKLIFNPEEFKNEIFQIFIGWPWDKLYKKDFILKNKLKFQEIRQSNDTYFVLMSLALANKISIVDNILATHRMHEKSLEATRTQKPECFCFALKKLYKELKQTKLFKTYEKSFINYAVSFSMWHIGTMQDELAKEKMKKEYVKLLQIIHFPEYLEGFFYDNIAYARTKYIATKKEYSLGQKLFSIVNSKKDKHTVLRFLGLKFKFNKRG